MTAINASRRAANLTSGFGRSLRTRLYPLHRTSSRLLAVRRGQPFSRPLLADGRGWSATEATGGSPPQTKEHPMKRLAAFLRWLGKLADKLDPPVTTKGGGGHGEEK